MRVGSRAYRNLPLYSSSLGVVVSVGLRGGVANMKPEKVFNVVSQCKCGGLIGRSMMRYATVLLAIFHRRIDEGHKARIPLSKKKTPVDAECHRSEEAKPGSTAPPPFEFGDAPHVLLLGQNGAAERITL